MSNDLSSSLKKEIKGKYVSGGGYWRSCTIKFDTINQAKRYINKIKLVNYFEKRPINGTTQVKFFGLKVTQKYDFESISKKFDKILAAEVRAAKREAEEKQKN